MTFKVLLFILATVIPTTALVVSRIPTTALVVSRIPTTALVVSRIPTTALVVSHCLRSKHRALLRLKKMRSMLLL
jgi:hypothetical protein